MKITIIPASLLLLTLIGASLFVTNVDSAAANTTICQTELDAYKTCYSQSCQESCSSNDSPQLLLRWLASESSNSTTDVTADGLCAEQTEGICKITKCCSSCDAVMKENFKCIFAKSFPNGPECSYTCGSDGSSASTSTSSSTSFSSSVTAIMMSVVVSIVTMTAMTVFRA
jgi:hypothetical protein